MGRSSKEILKKCFLFCAVPALVQQGCFDSEGAGGSRERKKKKAEFTPSFLSLQLLSLFSSIIEDLGTFYTQLTPD